MRDSINYNLKYFIMKMSGTKPIKNTMRKSPMKQTTKAPVGKTEESMKTTTPKSNPAGKPSAKPTATETSAKTPPIQMKKSGMKKKC